jgi:hypothetical protein
MDLLQSIHDIVSRQWSDLLARPRGTMSFRFLLQPAMAIAYAIRDGLKDAKRERSPFFRTILHDPSKRAGRIREELKALTMLLLLCLGMDVAYQIISFRTFYPVEALLVVLILAFIPYLLVRGPADRIARRWLRHRPSKPPQQSRQ